MEHKSEGRTNAATDHGSERTTPERLPNDTPRPRGPVVFPLRLDPAETWMVLPLGGPHVITGWTLIGGNMIGAERVVWRLTHPGEPPPDVDTRAWLRTQLAVRFSGRIDRPTFITDFEASVCKEARVVGASSGDASGPPVVRVVATVDLASPLGAGDSPKPGARGGIQVLVVCDRPLSSEARLEALAVATEAKVLALLAAGVTGAGGRPATGGGRDSLLVAAPTGSGPRERHLVTDAGKSTPLGATVGAAALEAVGAGIAAWQAAASDRPR